MRGPRLDNQDQHRDGPRAAVRLGHRDGFDSTVRKNSMTLDGICPSIQIRTLFCGNECFLAYDLFYLRRLFECSHDKALPPTVRTKYLTTWEIYRQKYALLYNSGRVTDRSQSCLNAIEFALTQACPGLTYDSVPHI